MPNAKDLTNTPDAAFLLVGEPGTHKTFFIGTCPSPIWVADFDRGMAIHAGKDIDYDTFRELTPKEPPQKNLKPGDPGYLYPYGTAWPAFLAKMNELGRQMDEGTCKYKTLALDSITFMTEICQSYILKGSNREGQIFGTGSGDRPRADWNTYLHNMKGVIGQVISWPIGVKVVTAHIQRHENDQTKNVELMPLIPGQFRSICAGFFDEVYYCFQQTIREAGKPPKQKWQIQTMQDNMIKAAKSRRWNVPDGTETDFQAVLRAAGFKS